MKNALKNFLTEVFILSFLPILLLFSKDCIALASQGLLIWYRNMIPTLFPFMVLSAFLVRSGLASKLGRILQPLLGLLLPLSPPMLYAVFMGFLCGFPMGAKVVADLLEKKEITEEQGNYLLSFCNNIGPLYMLGYVIPLFDWKKTGIILALMYGVPLCYGMILYRCSRRSHIYNSQTCSPKIPNTSVMTKRQTLLKMQSASPSVSTFLPKYLSGYQAASDSPGYMTCFQTALQSGIEAITLLGGCMVFFNCLQIYPKLLANHLTNLLPQALLLSLQGALRSLSEIGGGLSYLAENSVFSESLQLPFVLAFLTFGGFSCVAQTAFIIKNTNLSLSLYLKHKFTQALLIFISAIFILNF